MNIIMRLFSLSLVAFCLTSCGPKELPTKIILDDDLFAAYLSHETTQDELVQLQNDAKNKYQVDIDYSKSTFFEDGRLRTLDLKVKNERLKGATNADLMAIQFTYYGFKFDLDPKAKVPFKIGSFGPNQ